MAPRYAQPAGQLSPKAGLPSPSRGFVHLVVGIALGSLGTLFWIGAYHAVTWAVGQ